MSVGSASAKCMLTGFEIKSVAYLPSGRVLLTRKVNLFSFVHFVVLACFMRWINRWLACHIGLLAKITGVVPAAAVAAFDSTVPKI